MKKLSKIAIVLCLIISAVGVNAQNNPYISYYNLCYEAIISEDSLAFLKYQEAFSKVPYVYTYDYLHVSYRAANVDNYEAIFECSKQMILNGIQYP